MVSFKAHSHVRLDAATFPRFNLPVSWLGAIYRVIERAGSMRRGCSIPRSLWENTIRTNPGAALVLQHRKGDRHHDAQARGVGRRQLIHNAQR